LRRPKTDGTTRGLGEEALVVLVHGHGGRRLADGKRGAAAAAAAAAGDGLTLILLPLEST
jgi:hypothetical protein